MKIFILYFTLITTFCHSQSISYHKLDSISIEFSKFQKEADGYTYNDGSQNYEVSFPQENFKIWADNHLASYAIYKKWGNKEILAITENIDLSKATSLVMLSLNTLKNGSILVTYRLYFPKDQLNTTLYEDGKVIKNIKESYIDLFLIQPDVSYNKVSELKLYSFFNKFINLIYILKNEKGQNIAYNLKTIQEDWNKAIDGKEISFYNSFMAKYPKSIYDEQCKLNINHLNNEIQKLIKNQNYINAIVEKYKFEKGLSFSERESLHPTIRELTKRGFHGTYDARIYRYKTPAFGNPWPEGPYTLTFKGNSLESYWYNVYSSKDKSAVRKSYDDFINEIYNNVDKNYIESKNGGINIEVPGSHAKLFISIINENENNVGKWATWYINFY